MAVQITIIGLGQVGGSIGLALAAHRENVRRVGHDKNPETARAAQKAGAVDSIHFNLPASVDGADVVILALPLNEVRDTLDYIRQDLREGAVVMDVSPARRQGEIWAQELLPRGCHYVGLAPSINPAYLPETGGGLESAHAGLFKEATVLVCLPPGAPEAVARLATDLVRMLGATSLFSESAEVDGMLASVETLPRLMTVALANITANQPGWRDTSRLAGRAFGAAAAAAFDRDQADALRDAALANRVNIVRVLDGYIASLLELRDAIEREDRAAVGGRIRAAFKDGHAWLMERHLAKYIPSDKGKKDEKDKDMPSPSLRARMRQMFFGKLLDKVPGFGEDKKA